jgi:(2R)-sulfolactate sulfo-lyase subunit alpha
MIQFLVHSPSDTVGVAVTDDIKKGQEITGRMMATGELLKLTSLDDIPLGHKIALVDIDDQSTIIKYGHDIGRAVARIKKGRHVHVQNLRTKRW